MSTITFKNAADVNDLGGKQVNISVWAGFVRRMCCKIYVYNPHRFSQFLDRAITSF